MAGFKTGCARAVKHWAPRAVPALWVDAAHARLACATARVKERVHQSEEGGKTLRDGFEYTADGQGGLTYPFAEGPTIGGGVEIAPGVVWMRMPLGGSLAFINVWGLKDEGGWTLVDTGMQRPGHHRGLAHRVRRRARRRADRAGDRHPHAPRPHRHGRLDHPQVPLQAVDHPAGIPDVPRCWPPTPAARSPEDGLEFYRAAGWDQAALDNYATRFGGFGKAMHALPDSYRRVVDGEALTIGGREWRVVTGAGHSPSTPACTALS